MATPKEFVFVVRIRLQPGEASSEPRLRGSIQDVNAGTRFYVSGTRDIADFIAARMADSGPLDPQPD